MLALAVSALLASSARGEQPETPSSASGSAPAAVGVAAPPPAPVEARPGDTGIFLLRSGARLAGRLVARGADGDVIEFPSGERVHLAAGSVVGRLGPIDAKAPEPEPSAQRVRVFLRDGRTVEGDLVEQDESRIRIRTAEGEAQEYRASEIRQVFHLSELREDRGGPSDPARGRYLYVPSAWVLRAGQYQVAVTTAEVPDMAVGVTDWFTVSAGLVAPLLYGHPAPDVSVTASLTAGFEALSWLRAAGGLRGVTGPAGQAVFLFGTVTVGTPTTHLSLYAGPPMPEAGRLGRFDETILALGATARLASRASLLFEAWVTPRRDEPEVLLGLAARVLVGDQLAIDGGALAVVAGGWGPWLAVSWTGAWRPE